METGDTSKSGTISRMTLRSEVHPRSSGILQQYMYRKMYKPHKLIFVTTTSASLQLHSKFTKTQNSCSIYKLSSAAKFTSQSNSIANTQRGTNYAADSI